MKFKTNLSLWLPVVAWCIIIFLLSSIKTIQTSQIYWWDFVIKKTAHIIEYGILYFLLYRALSKEFRIQNLELRLGNKKIKISLVLCSMFFVLFYALTDEYHQRYVSGRHAKFMDIGFDSLGMLLSYWQIRVRGNLFTLYRSVK